MSEHDETPTIATHPPRMEAGALAALVTIRYSHPLENGKDMYEMQADVPDGTTLSREKVADLLRDLADSIESGGTQ